MLWDFDTWSELDKVRSEINNVLGNFGRTASSYSFPLTNIYDNKDEIIITAELAGMKKEDVNIVLTEDVLTLSGNRELTDLNKDTTIIRQERATGEFEKSLKIPSTVIKDKIKAEFKNGILTIKLPKSEEAKPKQITINVE